MMIAGLDMIATNNIIIIIIILNNLNVRMRLYLAKKSVEEKGG